MAGPQVVPRRRVPVDLRLADGRQVSGDAYVAVPGGDEGPEHLIDRLNDASERFLPIAVGERHLLIRKAAIVLAFTTDADEAAAIREPAGSREFRVEVLLSVGAAASGLLYAADHPTFGRTLDHLNRLTRDFVALHHGEGVTLVNTNHAVAVVERATLESKSNRVAPPRATLGPGNAGPHPPPV